MTFVRTLFYLFSQVGTNFVIDLQILINTYQSLKFITDVLCAKHSISDLYVRINYSLPV